MAVWRATWTIAHPALGGLGTNTWHARTVSLSDPGQQGDLNLLNGHLGEMYTSLEQLFAGGTVIDFNGEWTEVGAENPRIITGNPNALTVAGTEPPLPPATALVLGWRTNTASRRARGRTFLGPLRVAINQDNGTPTEAARTVAVDAAEAFIDGFDGVGAGAFGVWSEADQVLRDFTAVRVANQFASLRSRRD